MPSEDGQLQQYILKAHSNPLTKCVTKTNHHVTLHSGHQTFLRISLTFTSSSQFQYVISFFGLLNDAFSPAPL